MSDDVSTPGSAEEESSRSREPLEPTFEVGPPGVGPVTGIHSGEFFQPPAPVDQTDEPAESDT
jgi:hypothetical protein